MKQIKKYISISVVFLFLLFSFSPAVQAWDYGGDSDWGGDAGGSDWSGDIDWDSGGTTFYFGSVGTAGAAVAAVVIIIVVVVSVSRKKGGSGSSRSPMHMSDTSNVNLHNLSLLRASDPQFSEASMLSKVEHLFISSQVAYAEQNYEPMRPFLSNALYEQHVKQIEEKKAMGNRNVVSELAVLQSKLENYVQDGHTEYLDVWLRVKYKSYIGKISDPNIVVSGSKTKTFYLDFRWQFTRSAGAQTDAATDGVKTGECPNCGAAINLNQSGKCEYCGCVISTTEYDWVLSKIDALQQRSSG